MRRIFKTAFLAALLGLGLNTALAIGPCTDPDNILCVYFSGLTSTEAKWIKNEINGYSEIECTGADHTFEMDKETFAKQWTIQTSICGGPQGPCIPLKDTQGRQTIEGSCNGTSCTPNLIAYIITDELKNKFPSCKR